MAVYKVIGKGEDRKYFDDRALQDVIEYTLRKSKTPHGYYGSRAINIDNAEIEMNAMAALYNNDHGVRLHHSIISFDESDNVTLGLAVEIAETAIRFFGNQHQILCSIHEEAAHIHIHIVMNQVSYIDEHKYHGTRKEHYDFINYMKGVMRFYGISFVPVCDDIEIL